MLESYRVATGQAPLSVAKAKISASTLFIVAICLFSSLASADQFLTVPINAYAFFPGGISAEEFYADVITRIDIPNSDSEVLVVPDDWRFLNAELDVPHHKRDSFDRGYHFLPATNERVFLNDDPEPTVPVLELGDWLELLIESVTNSWALDRIDQTAKPLNNTYLGYVDGVSNKRGVHVYVVDTGVFPHNDIPCTVSLDFDRYPISAPDGNGHGTHVAGLIVSESFGVSPNPAHHVHAIRILDASGGGTSADILAGLLYIQANLQLPAVINMSIGVRGTTSSLNNAVNTLSSMGAIVVGAAGNQADEACNYFPPAVGSAVVSVGALARTSNNQDISASYSNFGSCVTIYAPGSEVSSTLPNNQVGTKSGTSMAAPIVAGAMVNALSTDVNLSPSAARTLVLNRATKNIVTGTGVSTLRDDVVFVPPAVSLPPAPTPSPTVPPPNTATTLSATTSVGATMAVATTQSASTTAARASTSLHSTITTSAHASVTASTRASTTGRTSTTRATTTARSSTTRATTTARTTITASTRATTTSTASTRSASTRATITGRASTSRASTSVRSTITASSRATSTSTASTRSASTRATTTGRASTSGASTSTRSATTSTARATSSATTSVRASTTRGTTTTRASSTSTTKATSTASTTARASTSRSTTSARTTTTRASTSATTTTRVTTSLASTTTRAASTAAAAGGF